MPKNMDQFVDSEEDRWLEEFFPNSSNLWHASYDSFLLRLYITFQNYRRYEYKAVPLEVVSGLFEAKSAGSYFHSMIRNHFKYREIRGI